MSKKKLSKLLALYLPYVVIGLLMEAYRPVAPMAPAHRASTIRFRQKP